MADKSNNGCSQSIGRLGPVGSIILIVGIIFYWEYILAILIGIIVLAIVWVILFGRGAKERKLKNIEKAYASTRRLSFCTQKVANGMATDWSCSASADEVNAYADQILESATLDFNDAVAVDAFKKEWGLDALNQTNPNS